MQSNPVFHQIMPRMKGRKFYIQLMITMICIGIIPPLIMNIAAYNKMSGNFLQQSSENNIKYLNQTMNSVEIIVNQILSSSQQLMLTEAVHDFESYPNGIYYEQLKGEFDIGDLPDLYHYLKHKQTAFENIRRFKMSNPFVLSVYLYESDSRMIYAVDHHNRQLSKPFAKFYDRDWFPYLEQNVVSPLFTDTRSATIGEDGVRDVLTIVLRTSVKENAIVINLDASKVYEQIFNKINPSEELFVTNKKGYILLNRDVRKLHENMSSLFPEFSANAAHEGYFLSEWNQGAVMVSYTKSQMLDWWFVNVVSLEEQLQAQRYLKQTILLFSAFLIAAVVCLSVLSSQRLYRPFSFTLQERDFFKQKFEESLPHYRERFKQSLLQQHSLTEEEILHKLKELEMDLPVESPMIWVISRDADHRSDGEADVSISSYIDELRLMEAARECLEMQRKRWAMIETSGDHIAILVSAANEEISSIFASAQQLLDFMTKKLEADLSIGISLPSDTIAALPQAYFEAQEALKHRLVWGSGQVIYYGDVAKHQKAQYVYPSRMADLLCSSIKLGNEEKAVAIFREWMREMQEQRSLVHYDEIMPVYIRLLTDMMSAVSETGYDLQRMNQHWNPYRVLIDLKSSVQVSSWFESFIRETSRRIQEEQLLAGNQHIEKVKQIIYRDFAKDVSLQSVSDELNLSPNYISRLFKQSTGQSFVDFVTMIRIERAKTLLLEQNLKVKEVCEMVGYNNSYYFIKVFKEVTGMTPGEYRMLNAEP